MPKYTCAECSLAVIIVPNEDPIKACTCDAPILAHAEATLVGMGGLS